MRVQDLHAIAAEAERIDALHPTPEEIESALRDDAETMARFKWRPNLLYAIRAAARRVSDSACERCHGEGCIPVNPSYPDPQTETDAVCPDCHGDGTAEVAA